jgi:alpha-L-fucosidase
MLMKNILNFFLFTATTASDTYKSIEELPLSTWPPPGPETDWFAAAGHGVFTHYLNGLQNSFGPNSEGKNSSWSDCVDEFDTEAYAASAAAANARYAIITVMQGDRFMIAPNSMYDSYTGYAPGEACARRDLVLDLSASLSARGIKLMLYYTGDGPHEDQQASTGLGWPDAPNDRSNVPLLFAQRWAAVLQEYAVRYGDKVSGWWIDGCYTYFNYTEEKLAPYAAAIRTGNPNGLIALNHGVVHPISRYSMYEDYTCGESDDLTEIPTQRFVNGSQWHTLSYIGNNWAQPGIKYNSSQLGSYIRSVNAVQGVVTTDLQLLRSGYMNFTQVNVIGAATSVNK